MYVGNVVCVYERYFKIIGYYIECVYLFPSVSGSIGQTCDGAKPFGSYERMHRTSSLLALPIKITIK